MPSMSVATRVEGLPATIAAAITHPQDIADPIRSR